MLLHFHLLSSLLCPLLPLSIFPLIRIIVRCRRRRRRRRRATRLLKTHRQHSNFVVFCRLVLLALWCRQPHSEDERQSSPPCLCSLAPAPPGAGPLRPVTASGDAATQLSGGVRVIFVLCRLSSFFPRRPRGARKTRVFIY